MEGPENRAREAGNREEAGVNARREEVKKRPAVLLIPLLLIGLIGAVLYYAHSQTRVLTDDAYVRATVYSISPRVPGKVIEVLVEDNQLVAAGQLLVRQDPEEFALKVRMAAASLEAARTQYEEAVTRETAAAAEDKLVAAQFGQAKLDLERAEALFGKHTIAKEQYDRAITGYRVMSAQQDVAAAKKVLAKAGTASAASLLEHARAQMANAELALSYTEIRSPGKGAVANKSVEKGNMVQPGFPLLSVVDLDDIWVEANYKETQLLRIQRGLQAEIEIDTYPGRSLRGHVDSIEAGSGAAFSLFPPENATGNWVKVVQRIPVKIRLDDYRPQEGGPVLRVGMSTLVAVYPRELPFLPRFFSFLPGF
jgi:membrane fusion protein (multidrug efflux system)